MTCSEQCRSLVRQPIAAVATLFMMFATGAARAQTYTVLHTFSTDRGGYEPLSGVTIDAQGNLYGTAYFGGANNGGIAYKLSPHGSGWIYSVLYAFGTSAGYFPGGKLVIGPDGGFYGTAFGGGSGEAGTVFELRPSPNRCLTVQCPWQATVLHNFYFPTEGGYPDPISLDSAGNIYGATQQGAPSGLGSVFKMTPAQGSWSFSVLTDFAGTGSGTPLAGVVPDQNGNVYGTGYLDIPGTVFEITNAGQFQILHRFDYSDGVDPFYGLIFDPHGDLFGQTMDGGGNGEGGTVFELSPPGGGWTFNLLYSFPGITATENIGFASLGMDAQGNLYGTTVVNGAYGYGTVFKLSPSAKGSIYTDLHDFTGGSDGCYPWSDVVMDSQGNLYGTASQCGSVSYPPMGGTVWEITP